MKNISSIALAVCLSFGLVACGGGGGNGGATGNSAGNRGEAVNPMDGIKIDDTSITFLTNNKEEKEVLKALDKKTDDHKASAIQRTNVEEAAKTNGNKKFIGQKGKYASYAGLLLNSEPNKEDVKYIVDAQNVIKDAKLALNAKYGGWLTITHLDTEKLQEVLVTETYSVSFTVKDNNISGIVEANRSDASQKQQKFKLNFNETKIQAYDGTIGFKGNVDLKTTTNAAPRKGTYEGVFISKDVNGKQADGLVGTFDIPKTAKGAYLAEQKLDSPKP